MPKLSRGDVTLLDMYTRTYSICQASSFLACSRPATASPMTFCDLTFRMTYHSDSERCQNYASGNAKPQSRSRPIFNVEWTKMTIIGKPLYLSVRKTIYGDWTIETQYSARVWKLAHAQEYISPVTKLNEPYEMLKSGVTLFRPKTTTETSSTLCRP